MTDSISDTWLLFEDGHAVNVCLSLYSPPKSAHRPADAYVVTECEGSFSRTARRAAEAVYDNLQRQGYGLDPVMAGFDLSGLSAADNVTGESGGLALAIALAKRLIGKDPGPVAATGVITTAAGGGPIGAVNGVVAKLNSAVACFSGKGWLLYPAANDEEIPRQFRNDMTARGISLCAVSSISEALEYLFAAPAEPSAAGERKTTGGNSSKKIFTLSIAVLAILVAAIIWQKDWIGGLTHEKPTPGAIESDEQSPPKAVETGEKQPSVSAQPDKQPPAGAIASDKRSPPEAVASDKQSSPDASESDKQSPPEAREANEIPPPGSVEAVQNTFVAATADGRIQIEFNAGTPMSRELAARLRNTVAALLRIQELSVDQALRLSAEVVILKILETTNDDGQIETDLTAGVMAPHRSDKPLSPPYPDIIARVRGEADGDRIISDAAGDLAGNLMRMLAASPPKTPLSPSPRPSEQPVRAQRPAPSSGQSDSGFD